ncbi:MAG: hypothetical protein GX158_03815 [Bacteroidales bacterium]|jgi:beta-glucosidase|nr:hypothetical protein [Bacteroidales bacterium]
MYSKAEPLYPFGYGLSYTTFEYSNLRVAKAGKDNVKVTVTVKNTGGVDGDDVVQVYVDGEEGCPKCRLRGFTKVSVPKGASKEVTITIPADDLRIWDESKHAWTPQPRPLIFRVEGTQARLW